jgi:hypothetical protein
MYKQQFDSYYETERKAQLNRLFHRSHAEAEEMSTIVLEQHKVTQAIRIIKKAAKEKGIQLKRPAAQAAMPVAPKPLKKRRVTPSTPNSAAQYPSTPVAGANLADIPEEAIPRDMWKERGPGVYVRSAHIHQPPPNLNNRQAKVLETELQTFGLKRSFVVNNATVSNAFDKLRADIVLLSNLQRIVKRKEDTANGSGHQPIMLKIPLHGINMQAQSSSSSAQGPVEMNTS